MKNELKKISYLVERNIKLYFKDKMLFFVSLITPMILVVLFLTFLRGVYETSLIQSLPEGVVLSDKVVNAFTGGWLFSSILSTSCITVAFCSNLLVMDKLENLYCGLEVTPIKKTSLQISYVISNFLTTLLICFILLGIGMIYLSIVGFYLSFVDVLSIIANMVLSVMFGCLLISTISYFIKSQGGLSAICTLVSSMYGFICGAYMPIHSMGKGVQYVVAFNPGTYGTVLFRQSFMRGVLEDMSKTMPPQAIDAVRQGFDGSFEFFGHDVPSWAMFVIMLSSVVVLLGIFVLVTSLKIKKKKPKKS